ncbi:isoaspartyl peptidase/L-asparaginase family protein [Armatimonas sp.]|uniref:isoaspartyl peptidase/L-asparaginase family protein n=1 Tax=Armatimonas sp. TaxID=1872638 RepID=UPI00374DA6D8
MGIIDISRNNATVADAVLVIHGGAGTILEENLTSEREALCHSGLRAALERGYGLWQAGADALSIVEATVRVLEDDPIFNAGRGAVLNDQGVAELDASIMRGVDRMAGAITGVTTIKNPITLARAVLEKTPFVFLSGVGAEELAATLEEIEIVGQDYFFTDERWKQLQAQRVSNSVSLSEDNKFGTVGAVARCKGNHLAAATSTGGMTNKRHGRIGDSPVIGAGTWAEDATCAVSATGHGEFFLRAAVAHEIAARMRHAKEGVAVAANTVIHEELVAMGGSGGVIALAANGEAALPFNTAGMYRGVIAADGTIATAIYGKP